GYPPRPGQGDGGAVHRAVGIPLVRWPPATPGGPGGRRVRGRRQAPCDGAPGYGVDHRHRPGRDIRRPAHRHPGGDTGDVPQPRRGGDPAHRRFPARRRRTVLEVRCGTMDPVTPALTPPVPLVHLIIGDDEYLAERARLNITTQIREASPEGEALPVTMMRAGEVSEGEL